MTKIIFLEQLKAKSSSEILYLCVEHILDKHYKDDEEFVEDGAIEIFSNYKNYHKYLNDFAGVIYNQHGSHIDTVYSDMCNYLNVDVDNKYTLEHVIAKLEKQTPDLLLGLTNQDIQEQTIEYFDEKLENIENSTHYNSNKDEFEKRVNKLYHNITIVKRALNILPTHTKLKHTSD